MRNVALLGMLTFVGSFVGTLWYGRLAIRRGIIATQNARTLHEHAVPRGGGIAFAGVFVIAVITVWLRGSSPLWPMLVFGIGGAVAAIVGFIDDVHDIRAGHKLLAHTCLAIWIFVVYYTPVYAPVFHAAGGAWRVALGAILLFVPMWLINLFNFIDGVDGMAVSASVITCIAVVTVLGITGGDDLMVSIAVLLAAASLGFATMNLPPARVFMGDAGSMFLGYSVAALLLATVVTGQISPWTSLAILGYYLADTTTTTVSRFFLVKTWYGVHRSHAYQNLARIHRSHAKVTYGVVLYQLLWALPLSVWSTLRPHWGPVAAALALGPAVLWTVRFGPRLSSD